jgi:hypothetical protein
MTKGVSYSHGSEEQNSINKRQYIITKLQLRFSSSHLWIPREQSDHKKKARTQIASAGSAPPEGENSSSLIMAADGTQLRTTTQASE